MHCNILATYIFVVSICLSQIVIQQKGGQCPTPKVMADQVISFLDKKGFLQA